MKIDEGVLYISDPVEDEGIEELIAILSQEDIEKIEIATDTIDPASLQLLLCRSKEREVVVEDEYLKKVFKSLKKER